MQESTDVEDLKITKEEVNKMISDIKAAGRMPQMVSFAQMKNTTWPVMKPGKSF